MEESTSSTSPPEALLNPVSVVPYLERNGIVRPGASAVEVSGGVSNVVLRVVDSERDLVVKQSLPRLRVEEEWLAPQERTITEAEAMNLASTVVPGGVPTVVHLDAPSFIMAMRAAPSGWTDWKSQLMRGVVNLSTAERVGSIIGAIHSATLDEHSLSPLLLQTEPFEQLRLRPYYEHTGRARPLWAPLLSELADELRHNRTCLVHGDLSPKNILAAEESIGADDAWIIDFEVAHRGDPRFDLAFLLTHLTMKAVHLPHRAEQFDAAAAAFLNGYSTGVPPELSPDLEGTLRHVGALLLARVHGKSPAEYLDGAEQQHIERLSAPALEGRLSTLDDLIRCREDNRS